LVILAERVSEGGVAARPATMPADQRHRLLPKLCRALTVLRVIAPPHIDRRAAR